MHDTPPPRTQIRRLLIFLAVLVVASIPILVHVAQRDDPCHTWSRTHSIYDPPPANCLHE
jgi:hypothetical protein